MQVENQEQEETKKCSTCQRQIEMSKFRIHEIGCARNNYKCAICGDIVLKAEREEHEKEAHVKVKCQHCQVEFARKEHQDHENQCFMQPQPCQYCEQVIKFAEYESHISYCGSKTRKCFKCGRNICFKDQDMHDTTGECDIFIEQDKFKKEEERLKKEREERAREELKKKMIEEQRIKIEQKQKQREKLFDQNFDDIEDEHPMAKQRQVVKPEQQIGINKPQSTIPKQKSDLRPQVRDQQQKIDQYARSKEQPQQQVPQRLPSRGAAPQDPKLSHVNQFQSQQQQSKDIKMDKYSKQSQEIAKKYNISSESSKHDLDRKYQEIIGNQKVPIGQQREGSHNKIVPGLRQPSREESKNYSYQQNPSQQVKVSQQQYQKHVQQQLPPSRDQKAYDVIPTKQSSNISAQLDKYKIPERIDQKQQPMMMKPNSSSQLASKQNVVDLKRHDVKKNNLLDENEKLLERLREKEKERNAQRIQNAKDIVTDKYKIDKHQQQPLPKPSSYQKQQTGPNPQQVIREISNQEKLRPQAQQQKQPNYSEYAFGEEGEDEELQRVIMESMLNQGAQKHQQYERKHTGQDIENSRKYRY